jgi:manganese transport protein
MLPLLVLTNSRNEMGQRFKNSGWVKVCGWISVLGLTFLNMLNLPDSFAAFLGANASASEIQGAHIAAYVAIVLILALLAWCMVDLYRFDKLLAQKKADQANDEK